MKIEGNQIKIGNILEVNNKLKSLNRLPQCAKSIDYFNQSIAKKREENNKEGEAYH